MATPGHQGKLKSLKLPFAKAHVMSKNFPLEAVELQKRLKLKEGEEGFVMGVTVGSGKWEGVGGGGKGELGWV
ncbi:MAG: hypothetical protein RIE86_12555 [Imperialibacter sp.]|uniref:THUMP-like domain-containing protein n=1 Tax=Imperialibacter sp. TaxID=2038411 RepID=UPI0032EAD0D5